MKTNIYKTYQDFIKRENKKDNGVSEEFAVAHSDYEEDNETNKGCWNCSDCSYCSGCSYCSRCSDCSNCSNGSRCSDCSYCSRCSDCSNCCGCSNCSRCSDCSNCSRCSDKKGDLVFPVIENIHQKVLEAVTLTPTSLNMCNWHTCETTHCRAGWVVTLAGEAGKKLEKETTTSFAAMMIYKVSSPIRVSPTKFYKNDAEALADIKCCAKEEINN